MASRPNEFLNGTNYQKIVGFLRKHYSDKIGAPIPERMNERLQKTVQHYMQEVSRLQAGKPLMSLNQEVVREASTSMDTWLRKQEAGSTPSAIATVGSFPPVPPRDDERERNRLFSDTTTNYERLMADRAPPPSAAPPMDFRTPTDMLESNEDPVILMQRLQKQREDQMRGTVPVAAPTGAPRLEIRDDETPSASKPTPPQAEVPPAPLAPRPQDYIIPQDDIVKYRETEYNIFLTSSDRDWLRNTSENRYNFSVIFNSGTKRTGYSFNAALQERFRNIQRVEFVKAIVPIESLTSLVKVTAATPTYDTTRVVNVFSLPFAGVRIAELNNNGFSTRPEEDNTFAMVQYDTTWSSDLTSQAVQGTSPAAILTKSGYTGLIPKFLKCQRVYTPTPLATLTKLSIRMERHVGTLLSDDSDVWFIKRICMSDAINSIGTGGGTLYDVTSPQNSYIFIQTNLWFPYSAVGEGDTIQFKGITLASTSTAAIDFTNWITRDTGHYVVAIGYVNPATGSITDGRNDAGYCNVIIIRNRFNDPTTGSVIRDQVYFGGTSAAETTLANALNTTGTEPDQTGAALINFSRQTHVVLRVITRDFDITANIRPDNV